MLASWLATAMVHRVPQGHEGELKRADFFEYIHFLVLVVVDDFVNPRFSYRSLFPIQRGSKNVSFNREVSRGVDRQMCIMADSRESLKLRLSNSFNPCIKCLLLRVLLQLRQAFFTFGSRIVAALDIPFDRHRGCTILLSSLEWADHQIPAHKRESAGAWRRFMRIAVSHAEPIRAMHFSAALQHGTCREESSGS